MDQYLGDEEEFISGPIALLREILDLSGAGGDQWEPIAIASANKKSSFSMIKSFFSFTAASKRCR